MPPPGASYASTASARAPELELADRARTGDQQALVQLYRRHRQALYRHAWRMLGEEAAALDVVQEAFARAIPAMPHTAPGLKFKAWIFRITTNLCLRELNRRGRTRPAEDLERLVTQPTDNPQHRREVAQQLQAALTRLPDRYRQILLLREVEELTYGELAEVLELSEGNVKVLLHRARARFAALVITEQLLSNPDEAARMPCQELHELLRRRNGAEQTRQRVERHVESCAACRRAGPAPECWALLPPPPEVALPEAPPARPAGQGSAASTGTGAAASVGAGTVATGSLVGWLVAGGLLLVGVAAGAIVLARSAGTESPPPVAAGPAARPPAARAAEVEHQTAKADIEVRPRNAGPRTPAVRSVKRAPRPGPETKHRGNKADRARTSRRTGMARDKQDPALAPSGRAPQAVDPESPPAD